MVDKVTFNFYHRCCCHGVHLQDMYDCLLKAGFKSQQVEQAMTNTVQYGGDLLDALDWLCLQLNHGT